MVATLPAAPAAARDYDEVCALMERYFEAFHHSDAGALAELFHPRALYAFSDGGTLKQLDMATYLPIVAARPAPASRGLARDGRVLAIEFAGPATALVKAESRIAARHFIDFLSLLKLDGRWWIVAKVFHVDVEEERSCPT
jgi:4-oxalocrotonate tautomerase